MFVVCQIKKTMRLLILILLFAPVASYGQITKKKRNLPFQPFFSSQNLFHLDSSEYQGNKILDTIYYPDKKIKAIGFYSVDRNGRTTYYRAGLWTEFYNNGTIKSIGNYNFHLVYNCCGGAPCDQLNLYKVGEWIYYYDNGNIKAKGTYLIEKTNATTSFEHQIIYKSRITEEWVFFDTNGHIAKDKQKIIRDIQSPIF